MRISHGNFRDKYNLNFPLISDKGKQFKDYGVESGSGTAKRGTFLIDKKVKSDVFGLRLMPPACSRSN